MSRTRLSKISMTPQGAWDSTTEYKRLDVVSNAGASWLAKQDNVGVTPVEGEDWMNLVNITKDGVVDALGYTPEKDRGGYQLIESIAISDDETTEIIRDQEPDGTTYNFKAIWVFLQGKQNVRNSYIYLNGCNEYVGLLPASTANDYWGHCKYKICGQMIEGGFAGGAYLGSYWQVRDTNASIAAFANNKDTIQKIKIRIDSSTTFTSGTKIYIYAVRA